MRNDNHAYPKRSIGVQLKGPRGVAKHPRARRHGGATIDTLLDYDAFLDRKAHLNDANGFEPIWIPEFLFGFQKYVAEWSIRQGRAAEWLDCGLGKTPLGLVWSENVVRHTNKPVLAVAPLGVAPQIVREADKFGIEAKRSREGVVFPNITVTNIERLDRFDPNDFGGVWVDEFSCIKALNGVRRKEVTGFMRKVRYRLGTSATNAPNDPTEFGTASEALGYMGNQDVLSTFFRTRDDSLHPVWQNAKWLFKAHAELKFYKYLCSFSRTARMPSDMGFDNGDFVLPPLETFEHTVVNERELSGSLFVLPAVTLSEQREERKLTLNDRCLKVAELMDHKDSGLIWAHSNEEGELLAQMVDGAKEVAGRHDDDYKEEVMLAFSTGDLKKLVTKPKIGGWGMNFQVCHHMTFFPSHSFESYYQGVRRCYRFGQKHPVKVDIVTTEGEQRVLENLKRKSEMADKMFTNLVAHMNDALGMRMVDRHNQQIALPAWL